MTIQQINDGDNNDERTYTITIDKDALQGKGFYHLEYTCRLNINTTPAEDDALIKNIGLVRLLDTGGNVIGIKGTGIRDKNWITTNIYTKSVKYQ